MLKIALEYHWLGCTKVISAKAGRRGGREKGGNLAETIAKEQRNVKG